MFDPSAIPRVFATPVGRDFCADLIAGLERRMTGAPPEAWARVQILVANGRMLRRLQALFAASGPRLMPRLRTVQSLGADPIIADLPAALPPLDLRLDLAALVARLMDTQPDLAPRAALYDLSDSLADLMGEMFEEGVTPAALAALDVSQHAAHWQRSQAFLTAISGYFETESRLTVQARQAQVVDALIARWRADPPADPILVAGSTGSRGATARLMAAVAGLPQGAVILPGLDRDMPQAIWTDLLERRRTGLAGEDHPQYRLARFMAAQGLTAGDVADWEPGQRPLRARSAAVSLALRPAPVTDQWREEGPRLTDLTEGFAKVSLVEAPTPTVEAGAIAVRLRQAARDGQRAALIAADARLVRMVIAALDRWGILPDVSAGEPLLQTVRGRFFGLVAQALTEPVSPERLVALLQHPTCHGGPGRGRHLLRSRDLELGLLRTGLGMPGAGEIRAWAATRDRDPSAPAWADWLLGSVLATRHQVPRSFAEWAEAHVTLAETLAAGSGDDDDDGVGDASGGGQFALYSEDDGAALADLVAEMRSAASAGAPLTASEYRDMVLALAEDRTARHSLRPRADILIWGTQEARVQGADLMILSGLNEGTWPAAPAPDPWLNRDMRDSAGLRLPDRSTGLAGHDFQQAMGAPEVWMTRALRDDETNTVPARWLNRLTNLLRGSGPEAAQTLQDMRARGATYIAWAQTLSRPDPGAAPRRAPRPAPCPPLAARPTRLSVTQIETLVRDPYAIYARLVLGLRPLDPLRAEPDAALRGTALHAVMERFARATWDGLPDPDTAHALFLSTVDEVLDEAAPWPANRRLWRARFVRVAPWFLETERARRARGRLAAVEERGTWQVPGLPMTISAKADRIDLRTDGRVAIYDYKSGKPPSEEQERQFNQQLWLEAIMAADGAFAGLGPAETAEIAYIGLGATPEERPQYPAHDALADILRRLRDRLEHHFDPGTGFPSRRSVQDTRWSGDYDQLARFGEWDDTDTPVLIPVGEAAP